jgi:hypothetical protein
LKKYVFFITILACYKKNNRLTLFSFCGFLAFFGSIRKNRGARNSFSKTALRGVALVVSSIFFAGTVIYSCFFGLKQRKGSLFFSFLYKVGQNVGWSRNYEHRKSV